MADRFYLFPDCGMGLGYLQQFVEFADMLRNGAPNRSDGVNGRANVAICLSILESAAGGTEVRPDL